jgi:hypothetical protein
MAALLAVSKDLLAGAIEKAALKLIVSLGELMRGLAQVAMATMATTVMAMAVMPMAAMAMEAMVMAAIVIAVCRREARGSG